MLWTDVAGLCWRGGLVACSPQGDEVIHGLPRVAGQWLELWSDLEAVVAAPALP